MGARGEIMKKYATDYRKVAKKDRSQILDQVCAVTGWLRDNARQRLAGQARKLLKCTCVNDEGIVVGVAYGAVEGRISSNARRSV